MPVYLKSVEKICQERAIDDTSFYYDDFKNSITEQFKNSGDTSSRQELVRLERWLILYRAFAEEYHKNNYIKWNDMFENEDDAKRLGFSYEKPRAPFIAVLDDF